MSLNGSIDDLISGFFHLKRDADKDVRETAHEIDRGFGLNSQAVREATNGNIRQDFSSFARNYLGSPEHHLDAEIDTQYAILEAAEAYQHYLEAKVEEIKERFRAEKEAQDEARRQAKYARAAEERKQNEKEIAKLNKRLKGGSVKIGNRTVYEYVPGDWGPVRNGEYIAETEGQFNSGDF